MQSEPNSFVLATKKKLRFETSGGNLNVEDLWDLSLKRLDEMAVALDAASTAGRKSFLESPDVRQTVAQADNALRLAVVLEVIRVKQDDNKAKKDASEKKARKEFLEKLRDQKQMDNLQQLSIEEIEAQLAAIG